MITNPRNKIPDSGLINGIGRYQVSLDLSRRFFAHAVFREVPLSIGPVSMSLPENAIVSGLSTPQHIQDIGSLSKITRSLSSRRVIVDFLLIRQYDDHVLQVDGVNHQPLTVDGLDIYVGQRYSLILNANQPVANYWVRAPMTLMHSSDNKNRKNPIVSCAWSETHILYQWTSEMFSPSYITMEHPRRSLRLRPTETLQQFWKNTSSVLWTMLRRQAAAPPQTESLISVSPVAIHLLESLRYISLYLYVPHPVVHV